MPSGSTLIKSHPAPKKTSPALRNYADKKVTIIEASIDKTEAGNETPNVTVTGGIKLRATFKVVEQVERLFGILDEIVKIGNPEELTSIGLKPGSYDPTKTETWRYLEFTVRAKNRGVELE